MGAQLCRADVEVLPTPATWCRQGHVFNQQKWLFQIILQQQGSVRHNAETGMMPSLGQMHELSVHVRRGGQSDLTLLSILATQGPSGTPEKIGRSISCRSSVDC